LVQQAIYSLSNPRKLVRTNWPLTGVIASPLGTLQHHVTKMGGLGKYD